MADAVRFYLDQHVPNAVAMGLRRRGIDAMTTYESRRCSTDDPSQLRHAAAEGRVLFTQDHHFLALHVEGASHAGIVYARQGTPIGEIVRGLVLIHGVYTATEMRGRVEYQ